MSRHSTAVAVAGLLVLVTIVPALAQSGTPEEIRSRPLSERPITVPSQGNNPTLGTLPPMTVPSQGSTPTPGAPPPPVTVPSQGGGEPASRPAAAPHGPEPVANPAAIMARAGAMGDSRPIGG